MSGLTSVGAEVPPNKVKMENESTDAAAYLYENTQFHDCVLRVGNPASDKVEQIGVVRSQLMAHSTVFRKLLDKNVLAEKNGAITELHDINPDVFRLMLKYIYGGQLGKLSDISKNTLVDLALCANRYNIQPLVKKVCKRLIPTSVDDVFPALQCVTHIEDCILEQHVRKIIQEQTDKLFEAAEFIELEANNIEFIVKQDHLNVTELDLWKAVVIWAEKKSNSHVELTVRQLLQKPLQYIRLATFSQDEVINHVMTTNILTPAEIVDLLKAISKNQQLESAELCRNREKRAAVIKDEIDLKFSSNDLEAENTQKTIEVPKVYTYNCCIDNVREQGCVSESEFRINTSNKDVELQDITINPVTHYSPKNPKYLLEGNIKYCRSENGIFKEGGTISIKEYVISNKYVTLPLRFKSGKSFRLEKNSLYFFTLQLLPAHPVYRTYQFYNNSTYGSAYYSPYDSAYDSTKTNRSVNGHMKLWFDTSIHLRNIMYKV